MRKYVQCVKLREDGARQAIFFRRNKHFLRCTLFAETNVSYTICQQYWKNNASIHIAESTEPMTFILAVYQIFQSITLFVFSGNCNANLMYVFVFVSDQLNKLAFGSSSNHKSKLITCVRSYRIVQLRLCINTFQVQTVHFQWICNSKRITSQPIKSNYSIQFTL